MSELIQDRQYDRFWLSRVLREVKTLARHSNPETASWKRAKQAIVGAATYLRLETGQVSPPIRLDQIKETRYIHEGAPFDSTEGPDAILLPVSDGFILRLQAGHHRYRQRFSTAHEIAHTFFYDTDKRPPARIISQSSIGISSRKTGILSHKEEDICSAFAAELLLPSELVARDLLEWGADSTGNELKTILELAKRYEVSAEVVTRRLMSGFSRLGTTVAIFKEIYGPKAQANTARIRCYKGKTVMRYLRKKEAAVFAESKKIIEDGPPYEALDDIAALCSDIVSVPWSASKSSPRLLALLNFHR